MFSDEQKLYGTLSKSFQQSVELSQQLQDSLNTCIVKIEEFNKAYSKGELTSIVKNANNKIKALRAILCEVSSAFVTSVDVLRQTEKRVFPNIAKIKKACGDYTKKLINPTEASSTCSLSAYELTESVMLDMYSISLNISIRLNRLTVKEKYTLEELSNRQIEAEKIRSKLPDNVVAMSKSIEGKTFESLLESEGLNQYDLPSYIKQIFYYLYGVGYKTTGVFRLAGQTDMNEIYAKYPGLIQFTEDNVITMASSLKKLIKDLPQPIITTDVMKEIVEITRDYNQQYCDNVKELPPLLLRKENNWHIADMTEETTPLGQYLEKIKKVLSASPIGSTVIRYFVELSVKISQGPSLMTANNLAICIAPAIFRLDSVSMSDSSLMSTFLEEVINNYDKVFNQNNKIYDIAVINKMFNTRYVLDDPIKDNDKAENNIAASDGDSVAPRPPTLPPRPKKMLSQREKLMALASPNQLGGNKRFGPSSTTSLSSNEPHNDNDDARYIEDCGGNTSEINTATTNTTTSDVVINESANDNNAPPPPPPPAYKSKPRTMFLVQHQANRSVDNIKQAHSYNTNETNNTN